VTTEDVKLSVASVDAETFAGAVVVAAQIYGEAMQRPPELVVQRREIMAAHVHRSGLAAALASDEAAGIVGFCYGYHGRPGDWWHDVVARAVGRREAREWLSDSFELAELHVLPSHHGQGLGRRLLTSVLELAGGTTAVLSTHDRESPARQLYRSVGFVDLLSGFVFPGSTEVYVVMGKRL
jgi:GNAT superfamily N-acetyltransferase